MHQFRWDRVSKFTTCPARLVLVWRNSWPPIAVDIQQLCRRKEAHRMFIFVVTLLVPGYGLQVKLKFSGRLFVGQMFAGGKALLVKY